MKNCNDCPHINMTEEEQDRMRAWKPHVCTKYNKRVLHGNQHQGTCDTIIPCAECQESGPQIVTTAT